MKSNTSQQSYADQIKVLFFLFAFIIISIIGIFSRGIWTDEAYTMGLLAGHFHSTLPDGIQTVNSIKEELMSLAPMGAVFTELLEADTHPPVYFAMAYGWSLLLGKSLEILRFLSLFFGLVCCWGFYDLVKRFQPTLANSALLLFGLSSGVLHYSAEARPYIASIAFLILSASFLVRSWQERSSKNATIYAVISGICAAVCFLTNYLALFPIGAIYLWAILQRKYWSRSLTSVGTAFVLALSWVPIFFAHHLEARPLQEAGWLGWPHASLAIVVDTIHVLYAPVNTSYPTALHWAGRLFFIALAILGLKGLKTRSLSSSANISLLMVLIGISTCLGMVLLNFAFDKHLGAPRYLLPAIIPFTYFVAQGVQQLGNFNARIKRGTFVLAIAILLSAANWGSTTAHFYGKTVYRDIASKFQTVSSDTDIVVAGTGYGAANTGALFYELPEDAHNLILKPSLSPEAIIDQISGYDRIWLVRVGEKTKELETTLSQKLMSSYKITETFHHISIYERSAQ